MDPIRPPACMACRHYRRGAPVTCDAFPARIPDVIWLQADPHTSPIAGDDGIRFEPKHDQSNPRPDR